MEMIEIESSQMTHIGYEVKDADKQTGTLRIIFKGGKPYDYDDVPGDIFNAFKASDSKGKFFGENLRGKFKFNKIEIKPVDDSTKGE